MTWHSPRLWLGLLLLGACSVLVWLWQRDQRLPLRHDAMEQDAFIWQRRWTAGLRQNIEASRGEFRRLIVLWSEITPPRAGGRLRHARAQPDLALLAGSGAELGLALRLGSYSGDFEEGDEVLQRLLEEGRAGLREAQAAGCLVREIHVDYDCPERRLAVYARALAALRRELPPELELWITGLPCWLDQPDLALLLAQTQGWVLQAHSLRRPQLHVRQAPICDGEEAWGWAQRAQRLGHPFRLALPSCGWLMDGDSEGQCLGLSAEQAPAGAPGRILSPDPEEMAALVRRLLAGRPAAMHGLVWFRLPAEEDRFNWRLSTLRAVKAGQAASARPQFEFIAGPAAGLWDLELRCVGVGECRVERLRVEAPGLQACDAPFGKILRKEADGLLWEAPPGGLLLRPGQSRRILWLRSTGARPKVT